MKAYDCPGSPPHTRGILRAYRMNPPRCGFTPAYAGNTQKPKSAGVQTQVHPRIRGEYLCYARENGIILGSPPHTRGILQENNLPVGCIRFTPAYAGNTFIVSLLRGIDQVHPRIRGEYRILPSFMRSIAGSPPHTRGIRATETEFTATSRFTPAYAGNT